MFMLKPTNTMSIKYELEQECIKKHAKMMLSGEIPLCDDYDKYFTFDDYLLNKHLPWKERQISNAGFITIDLVKNNMDLPWDWKELTRNKKITLQDIENNVDLPWDWMNMNYRRDVTFDFILKYLTKKWNWGQLSRSSNITMENIEKNMDLPWDWTQVSHNKNLNLNFVKNHMDLPWKWTNISCNGGITVSEIANNMDLPWNWGSMSWHKNAIELVQKFPDKCWDRIGISERANLTVSFVRKFKEYLNLDFNYVLENNEKSFVESWTTKNALITMLEQNEMQHHGNDHGLAVFSDSYIVKTIIDFL